MTHSLARTTLRGLFCAALAMAAHAAHAEPIEDCENPKLDIAGFTAVEPVDQPKMRYPREALNDWSEGWVMLEFAVSPQGVPTNMTVVDAIGPKDFVKVAVEGVSRWRYKPATRNGAPVEQSRSNVEVQFLFMDSGKGADHREFIGKYNRARGHVRDNRPDDAIAELERAFLRRLNLYEAAMGSFVLAIAYAHKEDWERALYHMRHANIMQGEYLEKAMIPHALALEVELNARTGNFSEAVCGFERLRKADAKMAAPDSQLGKLMAGIDAAMKGKEPLGVDARLAKHPLVDDAPAVWRHRLLRSKFWFTQIKGEVKSYRLACAGTAHEAPVDTETLWDVPTKAGPCILRVEGAPGATFKLVEEW